VYGDRTTDESVDTAIEFLESIGKDPVVVERDIPGFIANRIQSAMAREAWALLESGVASAEDIDRAVKGTFGFRLPTLGCSRRGPLRAGYPSQGAHGTAPGYRSETGTGSDPV